MALPFKAGQDVRYTAPDGRSYLCYVHMSHRDRSVSVDPIAEILPGDIWGGITGFRGRIRVPANLCSVTDRRALRWPDPPQPERQEPRLVRRAELKAWLYGLLRRK
jgi:hypothetical protein